MAEMLYDWRQVLVGLISDTHGLIRPEAIAALEGSELILHAGDVGGGAVLEALRAVAPVKAVAGNVDNAEDPDLEKRIEMVVGGLRVHVSHGHELGSPTPDKLLASCAADVIVYGHTHRALVHRYGRRLVINPGAAGPRRFDARPSVALLHLHGGRADVRLVEL